MKHLIYTRSMLVDENKKNIVSLFSPKVALKGMSRGGREKRASSGLWEL